MASSMMQAVLLTSLLANVSDFASTQSSATATSLTGSFVAQYTPPPSIDYGVSLIPNIKDPNAFDAQAVCPGYELKALDVTQYGLSARLALAGRACNVYGTDVADLNLTVEYQAQSRLHVNIKPFYIHSENETWFTLPETLVPSPGQENNVNVGRTDLAFSWTRTPFSFNVTRRATNEVLFSTMGAHLVYENQFIEFVTHMDKDYNIYGLGEVFRGLKLQPGLTRTIYAADAGDPVDGNIYGSHPFYLETKYHKTAAKVGASIKSTSSSHGVYLRNAHGQEILMHDRNVTWRTLGGEIDLFFFSGPTQAEVTSQYLKEIGLPVMQQYWTLGYHHCRWGYANWSQTEAVVDAFAHFEIPLETIWNDIDYMKGYRDFENDPIRFGYEEGARFLRKLHENGQHYIPIVDAAIYIPNPQNQSDSYRVFEEGNDLNVFLLNSDKTQYIGQVWPGYTVFPDWMAVNASFWWQRTVGEWYNKIAFDGLWIDMNEASSFCVGSCGSGHLEENPVHPWFKLQTEPGEHVYGYPEGFDKTNASEAASVSKLSSIQAAAHSTTSAPTATSYLKTTPIPGKRDVNHPPYVLNHVQGDLAVHAISPNATHHNGALEYDVHNLYGHTLLMNTYQAMANEIPGRRPFIIGRSTFVGSGNYSGHWGGDNKSRFKDMYFSIPQALSFSLFGIPMFGVDTCGFDGNTDEELCNRWMQLSAFFPFYRNHNTLGGIPQEPYLWKSVTEATKIAMDIRFQLMPYMYTLFHYAHTCGETVMRALAWEFPNDLELADADRQFFLGPAILVIPVLTQGHTTVDGVFPGLIEGDETYYDWYNQSRVPVPNNKNITIDAPLGHIPVYIRGGHVLATQEMRMTTRDARKTDWSLLIALDHNGYANGTLYLDDGVSILQESTKLVRIAAQSVLTDVNGKHATKLHIDVSVDGEFTGLDLPLAMITVLGVKAPPASYDIAISGGPGDLQGSMEDAHYATTVYDARKERLVIYGLKNLLNGTAWANDWSLTM